MPTEGAREMSDCLSRPAGLAKVGGSRWVLAALGLLSTAVAMAAEESTPLYLTVSETLTRDSNFSRSESPQAETVSSTALQFGLDKDYGRQNYRLSGLLAANRYVHYKDLLNNESKNFTGGIRSELLANWQLNLGGAFTQNLNPIKDNASVDRVVKNIRTYKDGNAALRYGLDGLWSVQAKADRNTIGYSRPSYRASEAKQRSGSLQATYQATDLLSYTLGLRGVSTLYPNATDINGLAIERTVRDKNVDLSTNWQVTGLSNLAATITRRRSSYSDDPDKHTSSWNGGLYWAYTPRGLLRYNLGWSKYSGADRQTNTFTDLASAGQKVDTLNSSTNYTASVSAQLSSKMSLGYSYALAKNRYNYSNVYSGFEGVYALIYTNSALNVGSVSHSNTVKLSYNVTRALATECSLQAYSQSRDQYRLRYQGKELDCTLSFTLE
jgi:hypothetical protein